MYTWCEIAGNCDGYPRLKFSARTLATLRVPDLHVRVGEFHAHVHSYWVWNLPMGTTAIYPNPPKEWAYGTIPKGKSQIYLNYCGRPILLYEL